MKYLKWDCCKFCKQLYLQKIGSFFFFFYLNCCSILNANLTKLTNFLYHYRSTISTINITNWIHILLFVQLPKSRKVTLLDTVLYCFIITVNEKLLCQNGFLMIQCFGPSDSLQCYQIVWRAKTRAGNVIMS